MTPANDNRPAGFDAALESYLPTLRKRANFLAGSRADGEELLQEAVMHMLGRAAACRMETFKTWAQLTLRSASSQMRKRARRRACSVSLNEAGNDTSPIENRCTQLQVQPDQFAKMDLAEVVGKLTRIPNGDILLRRVAGDHLAEIGAENGTGKENIRQKEERARGVLMARMQRRAA